MPIAKQKITHNMTTTSNPVPAPSLSEPCAIESPVIGSRIVAFPVPLLIIKDVPLLKDDWAIAGAERASKASRRTAACLENPRRDILSASFQEGSYFANAGRKVAG